MKDFYDYGELSMQPPFNSIWPGAGYIPWSCDDNDFAADRSQWTCATNKMSIMGHRSPWTNLGPFDPQTIMLYPSRNDHDGPVLFYKAALGLGTDIRKSCCLLNQHAST